MCCEFTNYSDSDNIMPTLLQINITANWGSTGKIAEAIGNSAINDGWESYIAYGRCSNPSSSKLLKVGTIIDTCIHYAYNRLFDMEGLSSICATKALIKKISDIKPDIIQLHNIHDHFLNYKILFEYLNKTNIKVVWTFHDCWAFTGHCYHFVIQNCMKWQTECNQCIARNKLTDRSRENFLLKKSLFASNNNLSIVACSEWMANFVRESFLKNKCIQVIHNGIDLDTFKVMPEVKRKDGKFRIIAVSNVWLQYKGIYDIFKLRELLPREYEITIVGLSKEQLKNLHPGICGIQCTQNVKELVMLYNQSDVLINPTYADTFPSVNLEALACGIPVITYNTGGSPESIDEKTGIVIEQGNIGAMANAIKQIKTKPLSVTDCRKRAEEYFNKDKCFAKYIKLYEDLI